ncbi:MAG: hypothetical protein PUP91_13710 [Rhizonema sp. PD37]|nr:hypothetical protein [Rhizonema sp. PD37]
MKIKTAIALGILAASQFVSTPAKAKKPFVYGPCRTIDIFLKKELRKKGIDPVEVTFDYPQEKYSTYPKDSTQMLITTIKPQDDKILSNGLLQKQLFNKVYKACSDVAAITLGVQQSGNDSTVGVPLTGTQPILFTCIQEGGTSKKLQWGTKYCK